SVHTIKKTKKPEEFGINKTDYFKTCILCRQKLDLPSAKNLQTNNNPNNNEYVEHEILLDDTVDLDNLEDYILTKLEACENNLDGIEINIHVVLPSEKFNNNEMDLIFQEVIKIIQAADGYKWNYLRQYNNQERFTCQGLVRIIFNLEKMIVHLYIRHYELHLHPTIKENVDKKVIEFIKNNIHLTSRQLWEQLQYQSHTLTQKQVHFWWTTFYQKLYLCDDDQFISTTYLLQEDKNYLLLYSNQENGIFEIAFTTPFLRLLHNKYEEIAMDATYKTNKAGFELYVVMANIEDVGYPLSYLMLNSLTSMTNKRGNSIKLTSIHRYTRYLFVYIEHVNTKLLDSSTIELDISSNSDN
ncbi:5903_t:CDS:2, partial [Cetraspora pellucida]